MGITAKLYISILMVFLAILMVQGQVVSSQLVFNQPYYSAGDTAYFTFRFTDVNKSSGVLKMGLMNASGQLLKQIQFRVTNGFGANQFVIPKEVKNGHYPMMIYTAKGQTIIQTYLNVGVKSGVSKPITPYVMTLTTNNKQPTRSKAIVKIQVIDKDGAPVQGSIAVSVLNAEVLTSTPVQAINKLNEKVPYRMKVEGRLINRQTENALPDSSMVMLYFQHSRLRYLTYVKEEGLISADILDYYNEDELFLIAETPEGQIVSDIQIEWNEVNPTTPQVDSTLSFSRISAYERYMNKKQLMDESYGYYGSRDSLDLKVQKGTRLDELAADYKTNPRDYIMFESLGEFIKTTVAPIYYGTIDGEEVIRVQYLKPYAAMADPLYVIDGKVTLDTDYFLSLNQDDIVELKVVSDYRKLVKFGLLGKNGIVIVNTKLNNAQPPKDVNKLLMGLNRPQPYNTNKHVDQEASNIPDFRACVHWVPQVILNANGEAFIDYYNADDVGTMRVYINGLSTEGQLIYGSTDYEVNYSIENK